MKDEPRDEKIRRQMDTFPVLPATVAEILRVTGDPESSAGDLMAALLPDQSLCATVLKLANSALFGRPRRVDSLQAAIMVLGFNEVQSIALVKAMLNTFRDFDAACAAAVESFWEHAFLTAMTTNRIALDLRLPLGPSFMAGLIHDLGKLVLLQTFGEEYGSQRWLQGCTSQERLAAERLEFAFDHAELGGQLLRQWQFPATLVTTTALHHQPGRANSDRLTVRVVQLADLMAHCCQDGATPVDATAARQALLPGIEAHWRPLGVAWGDELWTRWDAWLRDNRQHSLEFRGLLAA